MQKFGSSELFKLRHSLVAVVEELKLRKKCEQYSEAKIQDLVSKNHVQQKALDVEQQRARLKVEEHERAISEMRQDYENKLRSLQADQQQRNVKAEAKVYVEETIKAEMKEMQMTIFHQEKTIKELEAKLQTQECFSKKTMSQWAGIENKMTGLGEVYQSTLKSVARLEYEVSLAVSLNKKLSYVNQHHSCQIRDKCLQITRLQAEILALRTNISTQPVEVHELQDLRTTIERLNCKIRNFEDQALKQNGELEHQAELAKQAIASLQTAQSLVSKHLEIASKYRTENEGLIKKCTDLTTQNNSMRNNLRDAEDKMHQLHQVLKETTEEFRMKESELEKTLTAKHDQVLSLEESKAALESQSSDLSNTNRELAHKLDDAKKKLEVPKSNIGVLVGSSFFSSTDRSQQASPDLQTTTTQTVLDVQTISTQTALSVQPTTTQTKLEIVTVATQTPPLEAGPKISKTEHHVISTSIQTDNTSTEISTLSLPVAQISKHPPPATQISAHPLPATQISTHSLPAVHISAHPVLTNSNNNSHLSYSQSESTISVSKLFKPYTQASHKQLTNSKGIGTTNDFLISLDVDHSGIKCETTNGWEPTFSKDLLEQVKNNSNFDYTQNKRSKFNTSTKELNDPTMDISNSGNSSHLHVIEQFRSADKNICTSILDKDTALPIQHFPMGRNSERVTVRSFSDAIFFSGNQDEVSESMGNDERGSSLGVSSVSIADMRLKTTATDYWLDVPSIGWTHSHDLAKEGNLAASCGKQSVDIAKASGHARLHGFTQSGSIPQSDGFVESEGFTWSDGFVHSNGFAHVDGFDQSGGFTQSYGFDQSDGFIQSNGFVQSDGFTHSVGLAKATGHINVANRVKQVGVIQKTGDTHVFDLVQTVCQGQPLAQETRSKQTEDTGITCPFFTSGCMVDVKSDTYRKTISKASIKQDCTSSFRNNYNPSTVNNINISYSGHVEDKILSHNVFKNSRQALNPFERNSKMTFQPTSKDLQISAKTNNEWKSTHNSSTHSGNSTVSYDFRDSGKDCSNSGEITGILDNTMKQTSMPTISGAEPQLFKEFHASVVPASEMTAPSMLLSSCSAPAIATPSFLSSVSETAISALPESTPAILAPSISVTAYSALTGTASISPLSLTAAFSEPSMPAPAITALQVSKSAISASLMTSTIISAPPVPPAAILGQPVSAHAVSLTAISSPSLSTPTISAPKVSKPAISASVVAATVILTPPWPSVVNLSASPMSAAATLVPSVSATINSAQQVSSSVISESLVAASAISAPPLPATIKMSASPVLARSISAPSMSAPAISAAPSLSTAAPSSQSVYIVNIDQTKSFSTTYKILYDKEGAAFISKDKSENCRDEQGKVASRGRRSRKSNELQCQSSDFKLNSENKGHIAQSTTNSVCRGQSSDPPANSDRGQSSDTKTNYLTKVSNIVAILDIQFTQNSFFKVESSSSEVCKSEQVSSSVVQTSSSDAFRSVQTSSSDTFKSAQTCSSDAFKSVQTSSSDALKLAQTSSSDTFKPAQNSSSDSFKPAKTSSSDAFRSVQTSSSDTFKSAQTCSSDTFKSCQTSSSDAFYSAQTNLSDSFKPAQAGSSHAFNTTSFLQPTEVLNVHNQELTTESKEKVQNLPCSSLEGSADPYCFDMPENFLASEVHITDSRNTKRPYSLKLTKHARETRKVNLKSKFSLLPSNFSHMMPSVAFSSVTVTRNDLSTSQNFPVDPPISSSVLSTSTRPLVSQHQGITNCLATKILGTSSIIQKPQESVSIDQKSTSSLNQGENLQDLLANQTSSESSHSEIFKFRNQSNSNVINKGNLTYNPDSLEHHLYVEVNQQKHVAYHKHSVAPNSLSSSKIKYRKQKTQAMFLPTCVSQITLSVLGCSSGVPTKEAKTKGILKGPNDTRKKSSRSKSVTFPKELDYHQQVPTPDTQATKLPATIMQPATVSYANFEDLHGSPLYQTTLKYHGDQASSSSSHVRATLHMDQSLRNDARRQSEVTRECPAFNSPGGAPGDSLATSCISIPETPNLDYSDTDVDEPVSGQTSTRGYMQSPVASGISLRCKHLHDGDDERSCPVLKKSKNS